MRKIQDVVVKKYPTVDIWYVRKKAENTRLWEEI